jgi:ABC-type xylose transport system permease subunit
MLEDGPPLHGESRGGCYGAMIDLVVGGLEILIVAIAVVYTIAANPPDTAPQSEYNHLVSVYTGVVMTAVLGALLCYIVRRRWIASALQMIVVVLAIASIVFLHHRRVSGGLTGY